MGERETETVRRASTQRAGPRESTSQTTPSHVARRCLSKLKARLVQEEKTSTVSEQAADTSLACCSGSKLCSESVHGSGPVPLCIRQVAVTMVEVGPGSLWLVPRRGRCAESVQRMADHRGHTHQSLDTQRSLFPAGFRLRRSAISACFRTLADGGGRASSAHHDRMQGRSAGSVHYSIYYYTIHSAKHQQACSVVQLYIYIYKETILHYHYSTLCTLLTVLYYMVLYW